jgi:hypothetical protein
MTLFRSRSVRPPWPGYLVGGLWPGASDWHDVEEDYKTNEIAINWNGPLSKSLAALVEPGEIGVHRDRPAFGGQ